MASLAIGVLGLLIGILAIGQSLVILTFGIPTARQWLRDGRLTDTRPLQRYRKSLVALGVVLIATLAAVSLLFPDRLVAFVMGVGIGVVGSVGGLLKKEDLLADFLRANASSIRAAAEFEGVQKQLRHLGVSLREAAAAPEDTMTVVGESSRLMAETPCQVRPDSTLPYPRPVIEAALQSALGTFSDPGTQNALHDALCELETIVPDHEVPQDPDQRAFEYVRRRGLRAAARASK